MKTKRVISEESRRKMSSSQKKRFADGDVHPMKGTHHSEEWKKKMRQRMSGEKNPMYGKRITGPKHHMYGKHPSEETRKKSSKTHKKRYADGAVPWNKNKKMSKESIRKNSEARKKWFADGGIHPMKGKRHSEKTWSKMKKVKTGKKNQRR